jgi:hypothetical protein
VLTNLAIVCLQTFVTAKFPSMNLHGGQRAEEEDAQRPKLPRIMLVPFSHFAEFILMPLRAFLVSLPLTLHIQFVLSQSLLLEFAMPASVAAGYRPRMLILKSQVRVRPGWFITRPEQGFLSLLSC